MADFAQALKARIKADPVVSALTGQIHWRIVPQGTALPYIRLSVISDPRPEHLQDYHRARLTIVQVDCFAKKWGEAREIAEAVKGAVALPATHDGIRFGRTKAEGPEDRGEDTAQGFIHWARLDLRVEHVLA